MAPPISTARQRGLAQREPNSRLDALESLLGVRFRNRAFLELALTHKSLANESDVPLPDNERLEFLGDAILGAIVADDLYRAFPEASEGALTVMRAELVRRSSLAAWARRLSLGEYVVLGRGAASSGGQERETVLAASFEAIVGAIYLDRGQRAVRALIDPLVADAAPGLSTSPQATDAKSELQRRVQSATGRLPVYRVISVEGPEHRPRFTVQLESDRKSTRLNSSHSRASRMPSSA